jgi:hypothetical protein
MNILLIVLSVVSFCAASGARAASKELSYEQIIQKYKGQSIALDEVSTEAQWAWFRGPGNVESLEWRTLQLQQGGDSCEVFGLYVAMKRGQRFFVAVPVFDPRDTTPAHIYDWLPGYIPIRGGADELRVEVDSTAPLRPSFCWKGSWERRFPHFVKGRELEVKHGSPAITDILNQVRIKRQKAVEIQRTKLKQECLGYAGGFLGSKLLLHAYLSQKRVNALKEKEKTEPLSPSEQRLLSRLQGNIGLQVLFGVLAESGGAYYAYSCSKSALWSAVILVSSAVAERFLAYLGFDF